MLFVKHTYTVKSKLPNIPIDEGQLIFIYDKGELYFDNSPTSRKQITNLFWLETDAERISTLAPISQKFYYVKETESFWKYENSKWKEVFNPRNFATKEQGEKADSALQALEIGTVTFVETDEEASITAKNEGNRTILDMALPRGKKGDIGDVAFPLLSVDLETGELMLENADSSVTFEIDGSNLDVVYKGSEEKTNLGQIRFNFRGNYSPSETYNYLDWVIYQELSSVCTSKEPITGIAPSDDSKWQLLVGAVSLEDPIIDTIEETTFKHLKKTKSNQFVRFNFIQGENKTNTDICICGKNLIDLSRLNFKEENASISQHYHKIINDKIYISKSDFGNSYLTYNINLASKTKVRLGYTVNLAGMATFEFLTKTGSISAPVGEQILSKDITGLKISLNTENLSEGELLIISNLILEVLDNEEKSDNTYEPFIGVYLDTLSLGGSGLQSHKLIRDGFSYNLTKTGEIGAVANTTKIYLPVFSCFDGVTNVFSVNNHKMTFEHLSNKKTAEAMAQNDLYQRYCNPNPNILMNANFKNYTINQRPSTTSFTKGDTKASAWAMDRWYISGGESNSTVKITDKGIELILPSDGVLNAMSIQQNIDIETQRQISNKQLTISLDYEILQGNRAIVDASFVCYDEERNVIPIITTLSSPTGYFDKAQFDETYLPSFIISFKGAPGDKVLIKGAKLEVGDIATPLLPVSYEEELSKIKRIYEVFAKGFSDVFLNSGILNSYGFMDVNKISKTNLTFVNSAGTILYRRIGLNAGTALNANYSTSISIPQDYAKSQPVIMFTDAGSGADGSKPVSYYFMGDGLIINGERQL